LSYIESIINECLKYDYSLIPINSEKKPYIYWKSYQYKRANIEDIFGWCNKFSDVNIGIDDLNLLPELKEYLPELKKQPELEQEEVIITISLSMANMLKAPIAYSAKDSN